MKPFEREVWFALTVSAPFYPMWAIWNRIPDAHAKAKRWKEADRFLYNATRPA